jgi:hypothetical protein
LLEDAGASDTEASAMERAISGALVSVRSSMHRDVLPVPRIVDFEWRLDYSMSGTASGKSNEHRYTVKLHLEHEGVRSTEEFTASLAQLRDLQGRVQDAMEAATRLTEAE